MRPHALRASEGPPFVPWLRGEKHEAIQRGTMQDGTLVKRRPNVKPKLAGPAEADAGGQPPHAGRNACLGERIAKPAAHSPVTANQAASRPVPVAAWALGRQVLSEEQPD